jgi:site-specific recombinase XerD
MGTLARTLEEFFVEHHLALPTDQNELLATGRRNRRVHAVPEPLRPAVVIFEQSQMAARARATRAGTRPRSDNTLEAQLSTIRDLANFLIQQRNITDWASVDITTVEAFLATKPANRKSRLTSLRHFFRFARTRRLILIDPTRDLSAPRPRGFRGTTLTPAEQRRLFRRWSTDTTIHPNEALVGLLALLHGASTDELRHLNVADINHNKHTIHLGHRPHPVPLDPASWTALRRVLDHRERLGTVNPHVLVTKVTRTGQAAASAYFFSHLLDPVGIRPKVLRSTRLIDLVNNLDPKLVATAFGMTPEGVLTYFADRIDPTLEANL